MTEEATIEKKPSTPQPAVVDLSKDIEKSAERRPDESIKAVRVFDNYYRCNWWVADKSPQAFWLTSGTIRRSKLLRATKNSNGLVVEEVIRGNEE